MIIKHNMLRRGEIIPVKKLLENMREPKWALFRNQALALANQFKIQELKQLVDALRNKFKL